MWKTIFIIQLLLPITVLFIVKNYVVWPRKISYFLWNCNAINLLLSEKAEILLVVQNSSHFLNSKFLICLVFVGYLEIKEKSFHVGNIMQLKLFTLFCCWADLAPFSVLSVHRNELFSLHGGNTIGFSHPQSSRELNKMLFWHLCNSPVSQVLKILSQRFSMRKFENFVSQWNNLIKKIKISRSCMFNKIK